MSLPSATHPLIFHMSSFWWEGKCCCCFSVSLCEVSQRTQPLRCFLSDKAGLPGGFQWFQSGRVPGLHGQAELLLHTLHPRYSCRVLERCFMLCSCLWKEAGNLTMYFALVPCYLKHMTIVQLKALR